METHQVGPVKFYVLTDDEVTGMKDCIRDQGSRIMELEQDIEVWRGMYVDANNALAESLRINETQEKDAADRLAEEKAEADLFHAAYVGMCTMHPNRALSVGHSQQEH